jgi:hypothetical protein
MLLVHVEQSSARSTYVIRHVFERMLGWRVSMVPSAETFRTASGPRLSYSTEAFPGAYHVPRSTQLNDREPWPDVPVYGKRHGMTVPFPLAGDTFDPFTTVFHFLSLVEELRVTEHDAHGRVPSEALSIAHGLERTPLVDHVALWLAEDLRAMFPELPEPVRSYRHVLTIDVDNGLKYAGRSLVRAVGASARELVQGDPASMAMRWRVRLGGAMDPYAVLPKRIAAARPLVDRCIAFFLVRGEQPFDHAADVRDPTYRTLLRDVAVHAEVGLHPSYESSRDERLFRVEAAKLDALTGERTKVSRQHFLRWRLPDTLRQAVALGITEDHTLGFADRPGFRAGTCTPFPWYDLEREEETPLMLWPFQAMDSALVERMGEGPEEVVRTMNAMSDAVRAVKGTFVSVWHDRYLSGHREFAPWPAVFEQVVQHARP